MARLRRTLGRWFMRWFGFRQPAAASFYFGLFILLVIALPCLLLLPVASEPERFGDAFTASEQPFAPPTWGEPFGTDELGRSLFWRCLYGGAISLMVGLGAAAITVVIGVMWGAIAGYAGGRVDAIMMRFVDVMYGLPYILLVLLLAVAVNGVVDRYRDGQLRIKAERDAARAKAISQADAMDAEAKQIARLDGAASQDRAAKLTKQAAGLRAATAFVRYDPPWAMRLIQERRYLIDRWTLIIAIGAVSWLTMARVIRGQVLSLRGQPFVEAARACGVGRWRTLRVHLLPNLIGPIVVYTTLAVPQAILQESFLSFLDIGVKPPHPSWGNLASDALKQMHTLMPDSQTDARWWLLFWPCVLLGLTLLSLNFLGDALRTRLDPRSRQTR